MTATKRPVVSRRPALWVASEDGLAHARSHGPAPRTACGIPAVPERHAWPERARCAVCAAVIAVVEANTCRR